MKFLGITEEVTCCDCCGKSDLLCTVAFEKDNGDIVHYGRTCAARNSGRKISAWQSDAKKEYEIRLKAARILWESSSENIAKKRRLAERDKLKMLPGRAAADFVRDAFDAADAKRKALAAEFKIKFYEL